MKTPAIPASICSLANSGLTETEGLNRISAPRQCVTRSSEVSLEQWRALFSFAGEVAKSLSSFNESHTSVALSHGSNENGAHPLHVFGRIALVYSRRAGTRDLIGSQSRISITSRAGSGLTGS